MLALIGVAWRPRRIVWIYLALTVLARRAVARASTARSTAGSTHHVFAFRGFRAPARFAILACCAMSVLAGFGYLVLQRVLAGRPARPAAAGRGC